MAKKSPQMSDFSGGISSSPKVTKIPNSVRMTRAIDHRTDPARITINPKAQKEFTADALPMWGVSACTLDYSYCQNGDILRRDAVWSKIATAGNSLGNGIAYFPEVRELIYAQTTTLGKIVDACTTTGSITDDFLAKQGGAPTNTKSIDFEASSSMHASRADTASLSITGDLTLETYIKPESLPTSGNTMTLMSKWDENTDIRSFKLDIGTVSNSFGDGSDGALTISSNTTEAPIDANCTGTSGTNTITTSNVTGTFLTGQKILIIQSRGTGAGTYQHTSITGVSGSTITIADNLSFSPAHSSDTAVANKAQVRVLKQHTTVTINSGVTYTCKAWNGLKGGILYFLANTSFTNNGTLTGTGKGYSQNGEHNPLNPPYSFSSARAGGQGEGTGGIGDKQTSSGGGGNSGANGNGGGAGANFQDNPAAGGGHAVAGANGIGTDSGGIGGLAVGDNNLTTLFFGGQGGGAGTGGGHDTLYGGTGGNGGGILGFKTPTFINNGSILISGNAGTGGITPDGAGGGGGAGGSLIGYFQTGTLGTITLSGGAGGTVPNGRNGGVGAVGRVAFYYLTSYTGTSTPSATFVQDTTISSDDGYALRLVISNNGIASEIYSQTITDGLIISNWDRWQVSWKASTSTALFYKNGGLLGTKTGSMTAIHNNASVFTVAADFNTTAQNFFDGLMDDARVWNDIRTPSELITYSGQVLVGTEANLMAYLKFDGTVTDSQTSGLNHLTAYNTPTYSNDVPFSGLTTRTDQDQGNTNDTYSSTYTLTTGITETVAHKVSFVPAKEPQKSITFSIDTVSTGIITVVIHDALNRVVATSTLAVAEQVTGYFEFIYISVFRPILGATYHAHIYSSVADGAVDVKAAQTTLSDAVENFAYFTTHFQFLVSDDYHPMLSFAGLMTIGNERYIATLEAGDLYEPHKLTLPSGFRVRCATQWREYAVYGCWKGSSITSSEEGLLCFWDGISDRFNFIVPVPEGGVNVMKTYQDIIILIAGYQGTYLGYQGGGTVQRINHIPNISRSKKVEVAPGSMANWRTYLCSGSDLSTDSELIEKGVYTLGALDSTYPFSLGFEYPTSLGTQTSSSVSVGMVYASGQNLYIGWKNSNAYGIDKISVNNDCYEVGSIESMITDYGSISKERQPLTLRADFEPLLTGQSMRVKFKIDRENTWQHGEWEDTTDANNTRLPIEVVGKELEVGVDLASTSGVSPALLGWTIEVEALEGEIDV